MAFFKMGKEQETTRHLLFSNCDGTATPCCAVLAGIEDRPLKSGA
jgi:hypothetical protein